MKNVIAAALFCAVAAPAAFAGDTFETRFSFSRQALQSEAGAQRIYDELKSTIRAACRDEVSGKGVEKFLRIRQCAEPMIEDAVAQIGSSRLSTIHEGAEHRYADATPQGRVVLDEDA